MKTVVKSGRAYVVGNTLTWKFYREPNFNQINNDWMDLKKSGFGPDQLYVVETSTSVIQRCLLIATDPGDLVLDPTCGAGTTAYVAEQWGRRWITLDTSRVALALARARIMGARYSYYLLADSRDGRNVRVESWQVATREQEKLSTPISASRPTGNPSVRGSSTSVSCILRSNPSPIMPKSM